MPSAENEARARKWIETFWADRHVEFCTLGVGTRDYLRILDASIAALLAAVRETGEALARLFDEADSLYADKTDSHAVAARLLAAILREYVGDVPEVPHA